MVSLTVLGLNSGTSIDGIDIALCRISSIPHSCDLEVELLNYTEIPATASLRSRILGIVHPGAATTLEDVCDLNFALGEEFASAVHKSGIDLNNVDLIASHGQTLWHIPVGERLSTLQMENLVLIAGARTVISSFRTAELAVGRQGAPLSGFFEAAILAHPSQTRISQNIGGIGNATIVSSGKVPDSGYFAFDTGPGNVLIDATVRYISKGEAHYDKDGEMGARGENEIDNEAVECFLKRDYFQRKPPKTTGREMFNDTLAKEIIDDLRGKGISNDGIVATITRMTSESIVRAYENFVIPVVGHIDEVYICGGGACNPNIMRHLSARLPGTKVGILDSTAIGISAAAKEAVLFAVLGFLGMCGRKVAVANMSETRREVILGCVTPGDNYRSLLQKVAGDKEFMEAGTLGRIFMR
ncbi:Anhydro-N-acetylmuramic acid kinase [Lachnellula willkommii]|uniref:Anhydro-N-acetylmuramic acid kinase n=1 Tax=Lachnellula willkommii TaxID=215461 RepID=A0A559MDR5_9HELO|nr:Anhydro-N-acetylmuramic acid kinase [Lachnellula willkommii]